MIQSNTCGNGQVCQVNWTGIVEVYARKASWLSIYFILLFWRVVTLK